jgi:hypothetical protein
MVIGCGLFSSLIIRLKALAASSGKYNLPSSVVQIYIKKFYVHLLPTLNYKMVIKEKVYTNGNAKTN